MLDLNGQERYGAWMQTFLGGEFFPVDPRIEEIYIEDIAHALSLQCRYNGHCKRFYSVAEHCLYISYMVPQEFALEGLLHDASEAYLCDIPRPLKPYLSGYKEYESALEWAIAQRFGIVYPWPDAVKACDNAILICERDQIMEAPPRQWDVPDITIPDLQIVGLPSDEVELLFLRRFNELYGGSLYDHSVDSAAVGVGQVL